MDKKLVGLRVPAVEESFDILVPMDLNIETLTELLVDGICELCEGRFFPSHQEMLALCQPEMLLSPDKTLADYGLETGAQLVLI